MTISSTTGTVRDLVASLEGLLAALAGANPDDLHSLADAHARVERALADATSAGEGAIAECLAHSRRKIERLILQEESDSREALARINRSILAILEIVRDTGATAGRDLEELRPEPEAGAMPVPVAPIKTSPGATPSNLPPAGASAADSPPPVYYDPEVLAEFVSESKQRLEDVELRLLSLESDSKSQEAIESVFRSFHSIKGVAVFLGLDSIGSLAHEAESLLDAARSGTLRLGESEIDLLYDAVDLLEDLIMLANAELTAGRRFVPSEGVNEIVPRLRAAVSSGGSATDEEIDAAGIEAKRLGEILVQSGKADPHRLAAAVARQGAMPDRPRLGELLVRDGVAPARDVAAALRSQRASERAAIEARGLSRFDPARMARLFTVIDELAQTQALLDADSSGIDAAPAALQKSLIAELRSISHDLRARPLKPTLDRIGRMGSELAERAGKPVQFVIDCNALEAPPETLDAIRESLVHLVRNAVAHGIENGSAERRAAGKPEIGRVELRARRENGSLAIEVKDDGRGLDSGALAAKARERGIGPFPGVSQTADLLNFLCSPGLSTSAGVGSLSGRGMGMDIVRRNVEKLGGRLEVHSDPGLGVLFSLILPVH